jgi:zinc/manganese transport system substrate-binding protein
MLAACSGDGSSSSGAGTTVVVTTTILGDIVRSLGSTADVQVLLPLGADPHDFQASTRQAEQMAEADLLVVNGAGFEAGLQDSIEAAEGAGAEVFDMSEHVDLLGDDPHFWFDPARMAPAVEALGEALGDATGRTAYLEQLATVDAELERLVAAIPLEDRKLVTNHDVLEYYADRYGFEVIGAVIPSTTTGAEPSAADLDELAGLIEAEEVPAIFVETSNPAELADALAAAAGDAVGVVELYTESLGEEGSGADTYLGLLRIDTERIVGALS